MFKISFLVADIAQIEVIAEISLLSKKYSFNCKNMKEFIFCKMKKLFFAGILLRGTKIFKASFIYSRD